MRSKRKSPMRLLAGVLTSLSLSSVIASGDATLQITNSVSQSSAGTNRDSFDYTLSYAVASGGEDAEEVELECEIDDKLELLSITDSPHVASSSFRRGKVEITFIDPLPAGSSGQVTIRCRFEPHVRDGYVAHNVAWIWADNAEEVESNEVTVTATVGASGPVAHNSGLVFSDVPLVEKTASEKMYLPLGGIDYQIKHGHRGDVGTDVGNYAIEDRFPPGVRLHHYQSGRFPGTNQPIDVYYVTNLDSSWRPWPGNPRNNSGSDVYVYASEVGLAADEYVTGLRWEYWTLPGGGAFHPDAEGYSAIKLKAYPIEGATLSPGQMLANTANLTGNSPPLGEGLFGGHFDLDTSTSISPIGKGDTDGHSHEYDDKYNVVGGDFFSLFDRDLINIDDAIGNPNQKFKIIVANADLSPGGRVVINDEYSAGRPSSYVPVKTYDDTAPGALPVYSLSGGDGTIALSKFGLYFPNDALERGGLVPTNTGDVRDNEPGLHGEWRNGALTIQAVAVNADGSDAFTTSTALSAGGAQGVATSGLLWEATFFWHWDGDSYHENPSYTPGDGGNGGGGAGLTESSTAQTEVRPEDEAPPPGSSYGDTVFNDEDRDGFFTSGEVGINGVRVELYEDDGDGVQDPSSDILVDSVVTYFNGETDGFYVFTDLSPGNYYGVVYMPEGMNASATGSTETEGSLVANGSFEVGDLDDPSEWLASGENTVHTHTDDKAHEGLSRAHVKDRMQNTDGAWQDVTDRIRKGVVYRVEGHAYMKEAREELVVELLINGQVADSFETPRLPNGNPAWTAFGGNLGADWEGELSNAAFRIRTESKNDAGSGADIASGGDIEGGLANWSAFGVADIEVHRDGADDPFDGARYLWIKNRSDKKQGAAFDVTGTIANGATYDVKLAAKMKDTEDKLKVELWVNGKKVDHFDSPKVPRSFDGAAPWMVASGRIRPSWVGELVSAQLRVVTKDSNQEFKIDGLAMVEVGAPGAFIDQDFWLDGISAFPVDHVSDSDGVRGIVNSVSVAILPMTTLAAGESQLSWDQGIYARTGLPAVWAMAETASGKVWLGGAFRRSHGVRRNNIARVAKDGALDASFDPGSGTNGTVRAIMPLEHGGALVGGSFTDYNGTPVSGLVCVDSTGAVDVLAPQPNAADVRSIAKDGEGRFLVAGGFSSFAGGSQMNVVRLNADLSIDTSFNSRKGPDGPVNSALIVGDGKILLVGDFSKAGGKKRGGVALLLPDGQLDKDFDPGDGANGPVRHAVRKAGGKVVLVGDFTEFDGVPCRGTVRLDSDGSVDTAHVENPLEVESVRQGH